jgi:hypothetical protein
MLTGDEIGFLRAKLDEDEYYAKRAGGHEFTFDSHGQLLVSNGATISKVADLGVQVSGWHIARHDPARVLREVAVWRKLLLEYHSAPLDAVYGGTERETGFRLALSTALKAKIATYDGNPVTGEPFPSGQARG